MPQEVTEERRPLRREARWHAVGALVIVVLLLSALELWTFHDCLDCFFHFDDFWVLAAAARIRDGSLPQLLHIFDPIHGFLLYRPLSTVGYFLGLRSAFGYDPVGYHGTQIAFHILNAVLVYGIADSVLLSRPLAGATALIYATAPGHAIAACWLALFTMTGTTFLYFLAVFAWVRGDNGWRSPVAFLLFGAGLLASEHAVTLPVTLTAASALLAPDRAWRDTARRLAPFYALAGGYVAAKMYYMRYGLAATFPDPAARAYVESGYRMSLAPLSILDHIGRYCTFSVDVLYGRFETETAAVVLGLCVLLSAMAATAAVLLGRWHTPALRAAAFGLDVFIIGLGPVLLLPAHVYSYYVGIAAMGMSLGLVSLGQALPRYPRLATGALLAFLLAVHVGHSAAAVRQSEEFRFFRSFSEAAAGWLFTLYQHTPAPGLQEVVLPKTQLTDLGFDVGKAHELFLCAGYRVRTVPDVSTVEPGADRLILARPDPHPTGGGSGRWAWLRPCGIQK